jgi:hypothetical protein
MPISRVQSIQAHHCQRQPHQAHHGDDIHDDLSNAGRAGPDKLLHRLHIVDRHVRVEIPHQCAQRLDQAGRISHRRRDQRQTRLDHLPVGHIKGLGGRLAEEEIPG